MSFQLHSEPAPAASLLNPDAGTHAIPTDSREIEAALRAGHRSWRRFPYYELRYGERGRRFTASDSAWLVTLSVHPDAHVRAQIEWLGRILAGRGMPRWLLELHLQTLHHALSRAIPERRLAYAVLRRTAWHLRRIRRANVPDAVQAALAGEFNGRVGTAWSRTHRGSGALLVAAVADERAGIARAVESIVPWMTDPERFPPVWIDAVRSTIAAARRA